MCAAADVLDEIGRLASVWVPRMVQLLRAVSTFRPASFLLGLGELAGTIRNSWGTHHVRLCAFLSAFGTRLWMTIPDASSVARIADQTPTGPMMWSWATI